MKTIGICIATIEGGVVCHQEIGREAGRRGIAYPEIVTHTPLFEPLDQGIRRDDFEMVGITLADSIERTAKAGADFAIIPSNTMHIVFDEIVSHTTIPLLSIIDVTANYCQRSNYKRVAVLGTSPTMKRRLYDETLAQLGIETLYPDQSDQDVLAHIISEELVKGIFLEATRARLEAMAQSLAPHVDAILLGCTELPLVMTEQGCQTALVDTTRILSHAALDVATGKIGLEKREI